MSDFSQNNVAQDVAPFTANGKAIPESTFQALALNTQQNVVIEACAGSGKTWLLVARLLKLLLQGVAPTQIVAITFTRKAAQEMKARMADMLDELHVVSSGATPEDHPNALPPNALLKAMNLPNDYTTQAAIHAAWQRCRAQGEWPSIMTFHEWFGELRHNAPLSALSNAGAVLSDDESAFKNEAWQQFWADSRDQAQLREAMQTGVTALGLNNFESACDAMLARRGEWLVYLSGLQAGLADGSSADPAQLAQTAYVSLTQIPTQMALWQTTQALLGRLQQIASHYLASKTDSPLKRGEALQSALTRYANIAPPQTLSQLQNALTQLLQPLSMADGAVVNKKHYKDMLPRLDACYAAGATAFADEIDALHAALQQLHHQASLLQLEPVHHAVLHCGNHLIEVFQANKQAQRALDFTDLEIDALTLLTQPMQQRSESDSASTTRHILLDEFQDTNPVQWQALQAFVMPLLAEAAAGGQAASIFVVGDPKQSIYRFRRADPKLFTHVQRSLQAEYGAVLLKTQRTRRNAQNINQWVNAVFASESVAESSAKQPAQSTKSQPLVEDQTRLFSPQFTLSAAQGRVGVLPLLGETEQNLGQTEAQQVAQTLLAWKARNPHLDWSQAMVLARKRELLSPIAAALRAQGVASVSAERGGFFALPEIADTLSLLSALANPNDGLSLLNALRSPLFAVSDGQLSELLIHSAAAPNEHWLGMDSLQTPWAQGTYAWLRSWQTLCSAMPMHDALDAMMHQAQWAQRFASAVPERVEEISKNLAQLLQVSLGVDQGRYPSLTRFVEAVTQLRTSDMLAAQPTGAENNTAGAVRLSTIHGAKGLEADCVVMVGLYGKEKNEDSLGVLLDWPAQQARPKLFALQLCKPAILASVPALDRLLQTQAQARLLEQDTLLYVAMTRAVSELWISATPKKNIRTVYERLSAAFTAGGLPQCEDDDAMPLTSINNLSHEAPSIDRAPLSPLHSLSSPSPKWLATLSHTQADAASAQAVGTIMHGLLEHALRFRTWPSDAALAATVLIHDIDLQAAHSLLLRCQNMVQNLDLLDLAKKVAYLAIEESLCAVALDGSVQSLRPDLIAYQTTPSLAWVIDYKISFDPDNALAKDYADQLSLYAHAVQSAGYAVVESYILTLAGQCWQLLDNRWQNTAPPWAVQ